MPTAVELLQLQERITRNYPFLTPKAHGRFADEMLSEYAMEFRCAFFALGFIHRSEELDRKCYPARLDACGDLLRVKGGGTTSVPLQPFTAALIAHGDIPYMALDYFPHDLSFGLRLDSLGIVASNHWRHVLASGEILPPVQQPARLALHHESPQPRIVGGDSNRWAMQGTTSATSERTLDRRVRS
jgi:hypothetical protein